MLISWCPPGIDIQLKKQYRRSSIYVAGRSRGNFVALHTMQILKGKEIVACSLKFRSSIRLYLLATCQCQTWIHVNHDFDFDTNYLDHLELPRWWQDPYKHGLSLPLLVSYLSFARILLASQLSMGGPHICSNFLTEHPPRTIVHGNLNILKMNEILVFGKKSFTKFVIILISHTGTRSSVLTHKTWI